MSDDSSSYCSSSSSIGGPPPGGGGDTVADAELSCPPITESDRLEGSFQRKASDLRLDSTQTILENMERSKVAVEASRTQARFAGTVGGEEVSIVLINGEPYRFPDGKRLESTIVGDDATEVATASN